VNAIAFLGSPRRDGNSGLLLDEAIKGTGLDVRVFCLDNMRISPCMSCGECSETGVCAIDDDMKEVSEAIVRADRIVLASPIYFMGVSAQAKAMIDRCQAFWCGKYLLGNEISAGEFGRKGLLLLVGGMKTDKGVRCAEATGKAFFRTVSVPEHKSLAYTGIDAKGAIAGHPDAFREALEAGRELAGLV
jgi:NAD(P)H-dependent FMN reductase